jgi:D-aminopeptidase
MFVGVFADIEGSFGTWRMRQCRVGTREWQYGRECLTEDVNHVISAAAMKPLLFKGPLHFEAVFRTEELARRFNTWNFPRRGKTVAWDTPDMREGFEMLNRLVFIPRKAYPFRQPLAFIVRNYFRIRYTYFAPSPDAEDACR